MRSDWLDDSKLASCEQRAPNHVAGRYVPARRSFTDARNGELTGMTNDDSNVSADELEAVEGEPLPDREAMSILPVALDPLGRPVPLAASAADGGGGEATLPVEPPASE